MPNDTTFIEWLRGKRKRDLELPNEAGAIDPRLPPQPLDQLMKAFRASQAIAAEIDPLTGLQKAGKQQLGR